MFPAYELRLQGLEAQQQVAASWSGAPGQLEQHSRRTVGGASTVSGALPEPSTSSIMSLLAGRAASTARAAASPSEPCRKSPRQAASSCEASVPLPCEGTPASPVHADPAAAGFMPSSTPVQLTELSQPLDSLNLPAAVLGSLQQYLAARIPAAGMVGAVCAAADAAGRAFTSAHQLLAQAMQARQAASEVAEEEATACNAADSIVRLLWF